MIVRKFEGESLEQTLAKVKSEIGPNALVLSTQEVKGNWYKKHQVEVVVAFDPHQQKQVDASTMDEAALRAVFPHRKLRTEYSDDKEAFREREVPKKKEDPKQRYIDITGTSSGKRRNAQFETGLEEFWLNAGLSYSLSKQFTTQLISEYPRQDLLSASFLDKARRRILSESVQSWDESQFSASKKWTVIGHAGVGKTSLIVKLALFLKDKNYDVLLKSMDKRKLFGVQEIESYAKLLKLKKQPQNAIELIDTPSFSLGFNERLAEIKSASENNTVLLVLDAVHRVEESLKMIELAKTQFALSAIAFTRLDMLQNWGGVYEVIRRARVPLLGGSSSQSFKVPFQFIKFSEVVDHVLKGVTK